MIRRKPPWKTLFLLLTVAMAVPTRAMFGRWDGRTIREIDYQGLRSLPAETLAFYLFGGAGTGSRLDAAELNRRLKDLWERELLDDIWIKVEPLEVGVRLLIQVVERPILLSIDYRGFHRVSRADISEGIDRERVAVFENQPLDLGELGRLGEIIKELYKEKGYRFAEVSYRIEEVDPGQARATFWVDEGTKVRIGDIRFDGNTIFGDWRLRQAMKKTKEASLLSRFTRSDIYNPAHIAEDLEKVRDLYRRSGYKDILIDQPEIGVEAQKPEVPTPEEQKRRLTVTVPIEEGERWSLGEIRVEGNEVLAEKILLHQFDRPRGGWLRAQTIDNGIEKIDQLYKSIGYIFANIETQIEEAEGNVADVVIHIDERDQFRVGRVSFEGNTKTRDKVLRREMFLQEGSVMNMTAVQNSLLRIRQLNYFSLHEEEPVAFDFRSDEQEVDLNIRGEEAEKTELQFGGGWSEPDGFFGHFAARTTNFRGRGETLGISLQSGEERTLYSLQYGIPWFLDRPQNVNFQIFSQTQTTRVSEDFIFDNQQDGAAFTYGRNLRGFHNINLTYTFSDRDDVVLQIVDEEDDTEDGVQDGFISSEIDLRISSLRPTWLFNTLDSRFEPTRGLRADASVEIAGGVLGGDSSYVRPRAELTWFRPLSRKPFRSSFGLNVGAGWIQAYDDTKLFSTQRFFAGGESSVRGFRTGTISVREDFDVQLFDDVGNPVLDENGDPVFDERPIRLDENGLILGGEKMLQVSLEYHVLFEGPFRLVFFGDAGGVFGDDQAIDPGLLRYSAGAELRLMVPLFPAPLRFIYAQNLDPLPGDRFDSFDFSLSASF